MEDSILNHVKDAAGVNVDDTAFDGELIMYINSVLMILRQINVGPQTPFFIEDDSTTWDEFTEDESILPTIRSYVTLKVRKLFDPPTSSALMDAINSTIAEYEWRLQIEADKYKVEEDEKYATYFKRDGLSDSNE